MKNKIIFPAEWYPQDAIILSWPHANTDWSDILDEVLSCYVRIAKEILKRQTLVIICENRDEVLFVLELDESETGNIYWIEAETNDTWVRDYGCITVMEEKEYSVYDFTFNAWGMKFPADLDNQVNRKIQRSSLLNNHVRYVNKKDFVLEGGALESDGKGTLLTTTECLISPNRNSHLSKLETEDYLKEILGLDRILWLDFGYLVGDDTDSHIDTLARFCNEHTIVYVKCEDESDEHYLELKEMEKQLQSFVDYEGNPYALKALPMAKACYSKDGDRLPATYANFLIMNNAVLLPFYGDAEGDEQAKKVLEEIFPQKEIVCIDCRVLIKQHGSLHCITMQLPKGILK